MDYFNQLLSDLKTPAGFQTILNIINVQILTTPVTSVSDATAPNSSLITIANVVWSANGVVSFTLSYTTSIVCYYQVTSGTQPTFAAIQGCTDTTRCGVATSGTQNSLPTTGANAFTAGTTFNLYLACYNNIPNPQQQASVINGGSYTSPAATTTTTTPTSTVTASASSTSFSVFYVLLICFSLLF